MRPGYIQVAPRGLLCQFPEKHPSEFGDVGSQRAGRRLPEWRSAELQVGCLWTPGTAHPETTKIPRKAIILLLKPGDPGLNCKP